MARTNSQPVAYVDNAQSYTAERFYLNQIKLLIKAIGEEIYNQLKQPIKRVKEEMKQDSALDDVTRVLNGMKATPLPVDDIVDATAGIVYAENKEDFAKQINKYLGVEVFETMDAKDKKFLKDLTKASTKKIVTWGSADAPVPSGTPEFDAWRSTNKEYLNSLKDTYITKLQNRINANIIGGYHLKNLIDDIKDIAKVTYSDAKRIARTETGKLNGMINANRMKQNGVKSAVWKANIDERTRKSHKSYNGVVFDPEKGLPINPTTGKVNIKTEGGRKVAIYNQSGRLFPGGASSGGVAPEFVINCRCHSVMELTMKNIASIMESEEFKPKQKGIM